MKARIAMACWCCLLVLAPALAGAGEPVAAGDASAPCQASILLDRKDRVLQRNLEKRLVQAGFGRYLDRKQLGVALVDLGDPKRRYYAGVNDNEMMYAASLPKIVILLGVIEEVAAGRLQWSHELDVRLQQMVVASSNPDASWAFDLVGLMALEKTVRDPRYCFYDGTHGGLWVGRAYRPGGATQRDPLRDLSHGATARQAARFYTMLQAGELVSKHWSFRMLGLMSPPQHFHKFVGGLADRKGVVFLARKSGTWRTYHSDSALIQHFDNRYVLIGVSQLKSGEHVMQELARLADDLIAEGTHRRPRGKKRHARK